MTVRDPKYLSPGVPMSAIMVRLPELMHCPVCRADVGMSCRDDLGVDRIPHMVAVLYDRGDAEELRRGRPRRR